MSENLKYLKYKKKYIDLKDKVSNENILLGGAECGLDGFKCDKITEMEQLKPYFKQGSPTNIFKIKKDNNLTINLIEPVETLATYEINGSTIEKINTPFNFFTIEDILNQFIDFKEEDSDESDEFILAQCDNLNNFINTELKKDSNLNEKLVKYIKKFTISISRNEEIENIKFTDGDNLQSMLDKIFIENPNYFNNFITELKKNPEVPKLNPTPDANSVYEYNMPVDFEFVFNNKTFNIKFTYEASKQIIIVSLKSDIVYELFTRDYEFNIEQYESYMKFEINGKIFKQKKYLINKILLPADFTDDLK